MTIDYIRRLYDYNFAMNSLVLKNILHLRNNRKKMLTLMAHVLTAEKIWMMRLKGEDLSGQIIWPELSADECQALLDDNKKIYSEYLNQKDDQSVNIKIVYRFYINS